MVQTLDEFSCYKTYQALRLHFQGKMDFFKYGPDGGKIKVRPSTYAGRKDRYFFKKLAAKYKRDDLIKLLVANFVYSNNPSWVGDILNENAEDIYTAWQQRIQSLTYQFEKDCSNISSYMDANFGCTGFTSLFYPCTKTGFSGIVDIFNKNLISLESLIILNSCVGFNVDGTKIKFKELLKGELHMVPCGSDSLYNLMVYYEPFLKFDRNKIREIIVRKFK